jgi:hypothetical protein
MSMPEELVPELLSPLCEFLERFGDAITSEAAGIRARVDSLLTSRFYGLVALLSFVHVDDPTEELAVVDVSWRKGPGGGWVIDATGRGSMVIAEYAAATDGGLGIDMESAASALRDIENIIGEWRDIILAELKA